MRTSLLAAVGAAVAVAGLVGFAGTAAAAEAGHPAYIKAPATAYQHADNRSAPIFTNLKPGQQVTALCFTEGQTVDGNHNWFRISLTPDPQGSTGFVHRDAISVSAPDLRHC
ncbi:hypothetical protein [Pseudonocardia dioxanivorans]|uniref:hypothetical protein n=1 Tax=Pseudonocardia dioxanivorans TaxID=240495 RepID=UPI000CD0941A|nr:hypothetical protein [Pseudonocardia dioxanivorans]